MIDDDPACVNCIIPCENCALLEELRDIYKTLTELKNIGVF